MGDIYNHITRQIRDIASTTDASPSGRVREICHATNGYEIFGGIGILKLTCGRVRSQKGGAVLLDVVNDPIPLHTDAEGVVRVGNTRVTLDTIVATFAEGATAEEIVQKYPAVKLADVYVVLGYYLNHRAEVEAYLHYRQQQARAVRQRIEARTDIAGLRERLLARRARP